MNSGNSFPRPRTGTPETVRFLRRAAPSFIRGISKELHRESLPAPFRPRPELWPSTGLHAAWYGHSTVLLKVDGFTMLTDPVFSPRVGLTIGPMTVGIKRLVEVAGPITDLPQIDLILLSHAHMDHFDIPTLRRLEDRRTRVVTAFRTCDLLRPKRYREVHELRWNESVQAGAARLTAFEVKHWGARIRSDVFRGYNGYVIEIGKYRLLFGGDTAYTDCFRQVRSSHKVDVAIMPIGAYDPWIHVHCNPEQALLMAEYANSEYILPVHHKTFQLSREATSEPIERLVTAVGSSPERVCLREVGEEFRLA